MAQPKTFNKITALSWLMINGILIFLVVFISTLFYIKSTYDQYNIYSANTELLRQYTDKIIYLDEVLTMSARMGSSTGDLKWEKRYNDHVGKLDAALGKFISLAPNVYAKSGVVKTDAANDKLVAMEKEAFEKTNSGLKEEAYNILSSDEYEKQKKVYHSGIQNSIRQVDRFLSRQASAYQSRIQLAVIFLICSFLLVFALGIFLAVRFRLFSKELGEDEQSIQRTHNRAMYGLIILLIMGMAFIFWQIISLAGRIKTEMTRENAALLIKSLEDFRTLYTSEVVERVRPHGIEATHDYIEKDAAIPLPATLSMKLASLIGQGEIEAQARLYSDYPFPWRLKERGPLNKIDQNVVNELRKDPEKPFVRIEDYQGRKLLRFASADLMRQSCIQCHNNHPDSPKTDWKLGDVRGVLEVMLPLDTERVAIDGGLSRIAFLIIMVTLTGVILVIFAIRRLKRTSFYFKEEKEKTSKLNQEMQRANERLLTNEQQLKAVNQQLKANEQQLKASNQQLKAANEAANKARKELQEKITTLEQFHKVTVNREIRMVELKKRINELLEEMGRPGEFKIAETGGDE